MPQVVDLRHSPAFGELAEDVCSTLRAGKLVGLPSETRYLLVGSAVHAQSAENLLAMASESPVEDAILLLPHLDALSDFATRTPQPLERLLRRCWPGPVVVRLGSFAGRSFSALVPAAQQLLGQHHNPVCVPAFPFLRRLTETLGEPLLATTARLPVGRNWEDSDGLEVARTHGEHLETVFDSGPPRHPQGPTVIDLHDSGWSLTKEGVVAASMLSRLSSVMVLFVCTGNTCRSPMAEGLFRRGLAERLGCGIDEIAGQGFMVQSAGVSAVSGMAAAPEALAILRSADVDLSDHSSQPVTDELLIQADYVLAMTAGHLETLYTDFPQHREKMRLLSPARDISDPIGQGMAVYEECGAEIRQALEVFLMHLFAENEKAPKK